MDRLPGWQEPKAVAVEFFWCRFLPGSPGQGLALGATCRWQGQEVWLGKEHAVTRLVGRCRAQEPVPAAGRAGCCLEGPVLGSVPCKGSGSADTEIPRCRAQKKVPAHRHQPPGCITLSVISYFKGGQRQHRDAGDEKSKRDPKWGRKGCFRLGCEHL